MVTAPSLRQAAASLAAGETTPERLLGECLERLDAYEPRVQAWAYVDRERALQEARLLGDELKARGPRSSLHGIPIGVKDIIDVQDMPTGCGSALWAQSLAREDAPCVRRLRRAGAIILGKTVTTPFAYLDPPRTRNPWNTERTPGGSSSGSAAAVACGSVLAALGTQTGGSIIRPAAFCGVVGYKPAWRSGGHPGVLPLAGATLDHIGFFAQRVGDLAELTERPRQQPCLINEPDPNAIQTLLIPDQPRLAFTADYFHDGVEMAALQALARLRQQLESETVSTVDLRLPSAFAEIPAYHRIVMAREAADHHAERRLRLPGEYPPRITELIRLGEDVSSQSYAEALEFRRRLIVQMQALLRDMILVVPAAPGAAPSLESTGDPRLNSPWSFLGFPVITVPVALSPDGLPLGVQSSVHRTGKVR